MHSSHCAMSCDILQREGMGLWSEWHYTTREIGGWKHIITSTSGHRPNAFSLLYHTFWCKFKRQHISLKFIYNVTLIWLPAGGFVWRWLPWCFESRARAAVARAAIFIVCDVFKMRERRHGQMKNEIMNGNQGDHVTFVWSWRRSKQRLSFVAHFIHLFNTTMPILCTDLHSGAPMSHFIHRRVGIGCQALNFLLRVNYVFKMSCMHAYLQNVQPLYKTFNAPALWKTSQVWASSAARQERRSMFFNFTKIILVNIWILN